MSAFICNERMAIPMKKRILCAVMAAGMMAVSMASCGGSSSDSSANTSASENGSSETGSSEGGESAVDMDGDAYTVHFMMLNQTEGASYDAVASAVNNLALSEINMNVDIIPVTFGTFASTTQMMLASNEPLDLFSATSPASLPTYINAGYILNWADYIDQLPDVQAYLGDEMQYGYIGDFMAGIGVIKERANTFGLVARTDILDELGYTVDDFADVDAHNPSSLDKLDELFAAVQAKYPNMTVIAGQQGFASYVGSFTDALLDGYGVLANDGQDTTVTNWYESDQFRELAHVAKRWTDAHYYSSDAATSQDTGETLLKAGNMFSYMVGIKPNTAAEKVAQCGYDVSIIPLNGVGNYTTSSYSTFMYCLANASENPEKAAAFYNWAFASQEFEDLINWGIEGTDWVEDANGQATYPDGVDSSNVGYHNDFGWIYPNQTAGHAWTGNPVDIWDQYKEAANEAVKSVAAGFTYDSTAVTDQVAACSAASDQYLKTIAFGATSDIDATIDEFNKALYDGGLQMIMDEKQSQLDAWMAEHAN